MTCYTALTRDGGVYCEVEGNSLDDLLNHIVSTFSDRYSIWSPCDVPRIESVTQSSAWGEDDETPIPANEAETFLNKLDDEIDYIIREARRA